MDNARDIIAQGILHLRKIAPTHRYPMDKRAPKDWKLYAVGYVFGIAWAVGADNRTYRQLTNMFAPQVKGDLGT